jgi:FG-GAP repeat protein
MRLAIALLALAGCRQALGIPAGGTTAGEDGLHLVVRVEGATGASAGANVLVKRGDGGDIAESLTDATTAFATALQDGESFDIVPGDDCRVTNGKGVADGANDVVDVTCDGLVALGAFVPSAPLDDPFAPGTSEAMLAGSLLTQQTAFDYAVAYDGGTVSARLDATTYTKGTVVGLDADHMLTITVDNPRAHGLFGPRDYTFSMRSDGPPAEFAYGKAMVPGTDEHLGSTVAVIGERAVVGAPDGAGGGKAIVFRHAGRTWTEEATLVGAGQPGDRFGASVAIGGTTILVGAPGENSGAGAAYVFTLSGTTWSKQPVAGHVPAAGEEYGTVVAFAGTRVAIGSPGENSGSGAVHVIGASGGTLTAAVPHAGDRFGAAISATPTRLVIGAPGDDGGASPDSGAAYVFDGAPFVQKAMLKSPQPGGGDAFGSAVAVSGDGKLIVVGAPWESSAATGVADSVATDNAKRSAGAAFVFRDTGAIAFAHYVKAPNSDAGDEFGTSIALRGRALVIGAPYEDSNGTSPTNETKTDAGAVYVYSVAGGDVVNAPPNYVKASNPSDHDAFGTSLSLSDEMLVVGAPFEDSSASGWNGNKGDGAFDTGAVYTYR